MENACQTFNKLKNKGVLIDSDYMQSLNTSCTQTTKTNQVATTPAKNNIIKILAVLVFIAAITFFVIKRKKNDNKI